MSELRQLAEAATPGPWHAFIDNYGEDTWPGSMFVTADPHESQTPLCVDLTQADAAYIAAASPDVILRLLDRLDTVDDALRKRTAMAQGLIDGILDLAATLRLSSVQRKRIADLRDEARAVLSEPKP